jgi:IS30 family transposase
MDDIHTAKKVADEADARLLDLIDRAHGAGVTYRTIAPVIGVVPQTITRRIDQAKKRQHQNNERGGEHHG